MQSILRGQTSNNLSSQRMQGYSHGGEQISMLSLSQTSLSEASYGVESSVHMIFNLDFVFVF